MTKAILALLIILIGVKIVTDSRTFSFKNSIVKLADQDEENKNEEKEKKTDKRYNEDLFNTTDHPDLMTEVIATSAISIKHQKLYLRFIDKPNTPPPNYI